MEDDDWYDWDERECCKRGTMVQYIGEFRPLALCLEGTAWIWPEGRTNLMCNESYRMFGEIERLLDGKPDH